MKAYRSLLWQLLPVNFLLVALMAFAALLMAHWLSPEHEDPAVDASLWQAAYTKSLPAGYTRNDGENMILLHVGEDGLLLDVESRWPLYGDLAQAMAISINSFSSNQGTLDIEGRRYVYLRLDSVIALRSLPEPGSFIRVSSSFWIALLVLLLLICATSVAVTLRMQAPLQAVWQNQENFAADTARVLEPALRRIRAQMEVLRGENDPDRQRKLAALNDEIHRISLFADYLRSIHSADLSPSEALPFSISQVASDSAQRWQSLLAEKGLQFTSDVQPSLFCLGRQEEVRQLIDILMDNAAKYTPAPGSVTLVLREHKGAARLMVEDSGKGLDEDVLPRIFDYFYRGDESVEGFGLGLPIAMQISARHGCEVQVHSAPGEGSCFAITFPLLH